MKRFLAVTAVLFGGLAIAGVVLNRMGRFSPSRTAQAGSVSVIGTCDGPTAVFVVKKAVPLISRNCRIRFFSTLSMLSAARFFRMKQDKEKLGKFTKYYE